MEAKTEGIHGMSDRQTLGYKYARGSGIEVGAMTTPWIVPRESHVTYYDKYSIEENRVRNPDVGPNRKIYCDVVDCAETLALAPNDHFDFLCSSHVLEHMENALLALENWLRVVKVGGYVIMAIPDKRFTFDKPRPVTPFSHIWMEYCYPDLAKGNRGIHYREFAINVSKMVESPAFDEEVARFASGISDTHFHCWDASGIKEMLELFRDGDIYPAAELKFRATPRYEIVEFSDNQFEVMTVLRKL